MRVMRLTAFILLVFCLQASATGLSQSVTLRGNQLPIEKVLQEVEKQTGLFVSYKLNQIKDAKPVTIAAYNMPLLEFLQAVLADQPFTYAIESNTIFINRKLSSLTTDLSPRLNLSPPPITVRGKILNEKGEPVVATIVVKGTNKGATTDAEGNFEMVNVNDNAQLIISGINIETQTIAINGRNSLTINVKTKIAAQEEVIINGGYYKVEDRKRTGNIARVEAKDIERQPVTSPLMALQGRMAGVDVTPATGMPGIFTRIQIRGNNSINSGNNPLYVIDGVPIDSRPVKTNSASTNMVGDGFDPLSTIQPSNIASIEVLKDADATSIYGSRGANGVVLITTKRGNASGRTSFDLNAYQGAGHITSKLDMMNTAQYLEMRREAFVNDNVVPEWYEFDLTEWDSTRNTDWLQELLGQTSQITDASAGLNSGNAQLNYRLNAGYHRETLVIPGDFGYQRISGSFALNHQSTDGKLKSQVTINYGSDQNKQFDDAGDLVGRAVSLPPNAPALYDEKGDLNFENNTFTNPLLTTRRSHRTLNDGLNIGTEVRYRLIKDLELKIVLGYNDLNGTERLRNPIASIEPLYQHYYNAAGSNTNYKRRSWNVEPMVNYTAHTKGATINLLAGSTMQQASFVSTGLAWSGAKSDLVIEDPNAGTGVAGFGVDNTRYSYASFFARAGFDYKGKYIININARRDGSSRFGPGNKWANFGSVGAAWVFSDENLIREKLSFLSFGKLRGSYGTTGNDQIGDYKYYDFFAMHYTPYGPYMASYSSALFNPDYRWELTKKFEVAIDLAFLNNRAGLELSWYRNRSTWQLMGNSLPYITGFEQIFANFPATVQNAGLELVMRGTPVQARNLKWDVSFNFSLSKNKLVAYPGLESSPYASSYQIGQPLSTTKYYPATTVDPATGLYEEKDVNGDGLITHLDRTELFNLAPKFFGGLLNSFQFKNIQFNFLFQFTRRNVINYSSAMPGTMANQKTEVLDRWRKPGDEARYQRFSQLYYGEANTSYGTYTSSINNTYTGSYLRLRTASLSYRLPASVLGNNNRSLSVYLQGQNLFTISENTMLDPETGMSMPPLRMITFGLQLTI